MKKEKITPTVKRSVLQENCSRAGKANSPEHLKRISMLGVKARAKNRKKRELELKNVTK